MREMGLFFQNQILGMHWLKELIQNLLELIGISAQSIVGGMLNFFFYDLIKIFILLSVLIFGISYIQSYFPPERSKKLLGRFRGIKGNVIGALLGTVTPFCSCSSIPIFMGFTSAGLPLGVTFSFLISSPMVDLGSLALLMSIFGGKIAFAYVIVGLIVAVIGGSLIEKLHLEQEVEDYIRQAATLLMSIFGGKIAFAYVIVGLIVAVIGGSLIEKLHLEQEVEDYIRQAASMDAELPKLTVKDRLEYAKEQVKSTIRKVAPYIFAGVAIGAMIHNLIPEAWIEQILGGRHFYSVPLAVLVGIPMYADIFGTIPIAESLLIKGAGLGTILAFMMAVTTLSLPSLVMLSKAVKRKLLLIFTGIVTVGIILVAGLGTILAFMMAVTTLSLPSLVMLSKAVKRKLLLIFTGIVTVGIILVGYLFNAGAWFFFS